MIPAGLPNSLILRTLEKKVAQLEVAEQRKPPLLEWLKALRDRVAPEITYTNVTFPLFTPHDELNHIHPLFFLAERLLTPELIESLNANELFVFACALYGHDWGMAVSEQEKKYISSRIGADSQDETAADDEAVRFATFVRQQSNSPEVTPDNIPGSVWQNYIRQTHARRSAERIKRFFAELDSMCGAAIAHVCEGHNLDIEQVREFDTALPLQGEIVNVRALALYVRLTDLFDIAKDRTPLALWKFVSPEDVTSAAEWKKHEALSPIAVDAFQETSRRIIVRGLTDDHDVYASLEDLREYCDSQLRLTNGLLNELEPRYQARLVFLDWNVEAVGFEPVSVRFQFDRSNVIELLSAEIYQGDQYVFLRELLQNSIDAIRLRTALHDKKKTGIRFDGTIKVRVEHKEDGATVITWADNGAGMNLFVVQNYLTVVGKSFYRSDDFKRLGITMDAISRFGIGILSCFMVAERLQIETRQDPQIEAAPEALRINIQDPTRHLRVERIALSRAPANPGTAITVFVPATVKTKTGGIAARARLEVTAYLKEIVGFVEVPVFIEEDGLRTVILHPSRSAAANEFSGWNTHKVNEGFKWAEFFLPQDVAAAKQAFLEQRLVMTLDETNPYFEGTITSPIIKDDFELKYHIGSTGEFTEHYVVRGDVLLWKVRVANRWPRNPPEPSLARSSTCDDRCRVYADGILVGGVTPPAWIGGGWMTPTTYHLTVNISRSTSLSLDLSRHEILGASNWIEFVRERCVQKFREDALKLASIKPLEAAYYALVRLFAYGTGFLGPRFEMLRSLSVPLVVLDERGHITTCSSDALNNSWLATVPKELAQRLGKATLAAWGTAEWLQPAPTIEWHGGMCLFGDGMTYGF